MSVVKLRETHTAKAARDTITARRCRTPAVPGFWSTLALNLIIPTAQIIGGLLAGSVALISDAVHNFSDFTALLISYIAFRIGRRGATAFNTFGYRRAEIMAALINVLLLAGASGIILYHAVERFFNPQAVNGLVVIILAGVGVVGNGLSAWLLHRDAAHSLNVRGAFLHMVGDLLTSVAVLDQRCLADVLSVVLARPAAVGLDRCVYLEKRMGPSQGVHGGANERHSRPYQP